MRLVTDLIRPRKFVYYSCFSNPYDLYAGYILSVNEHVFEILECRDEKVTPNIFMLRSDEVIDFTFGVPRENRCPIDERVAVESMSYSSFETMKDLLGHCKLSKICVEINSMKLLDPSQLSVIDLDEDGVVCSEMQDCQEVHSIFSWDDIKVVRVPDFIGRTTGDDDGK